jgi:hypothetical protein
MTSLEKAQYIVEHGHCKNISCENCILRGKHSINEHTYELSSESIQIAKDYIEKETKMETMVPGTKVCVSDKSEMHSLEEKNIRLYVCPAPSGGHYCVASGYGDSDFINGCNNVEICHWNYVVPYTEIPAKEMTIEEIKKDLSYTIEVVE